MAGVQVEIVANQIDKQRLGYLALSLTNYDADTEPQIAAGSKVEVAGALFEFTALESITGWAGIGVSNDVYIKLVVAGTAVAAEFTTTAPTWDTAKQGFYGTAGSALHRYVAKLYKDGAGAYTLKRILPGTQAVPVLIAKVVEIGDWNMDSTAAKAVAHGLEYSKIRTVEAFIRLDAPLVGVYSIYTSAAGSAGWDATNVNLERQPAAFFDQVNFDATPYNRGWVTIWYEA